MKRTFSLLLVLVCGLVFTSCLKEDTGFGVITPEISKKWINAASGNYRGMINVINTETGDGETFTTEAIVTPNDSIITIAKFPVKALAKYAIGETAEMLKNCDESVNGTFKAELHPYNGGVPHTYTFYMFPTTETMDVSTTWKGVKYNISIAWAPDMTLPENVAIRYGERYIFPIADFDVTLSTIYGHILIKEFKVNNEVYDTPILYDLNISKTSATW